MADQVAADHRHARLTPRERALVDFAVKVTREPATIEESACEGRGSDANIWDAGSVAAVFNLSNRMASLADVQPNREFYRMGRG